MSGGFRLLGDLEVWIEGRPIDLGHARQRHVLAVLLYDANRPVPADRLVDRVWGEGGLHRSRGTLYSYLSRVRGLLTPFKDVTLRRVPAGYLLSVPSESVDLLRFRRLVAEARASSDQRAMVLFTQALGLWRGEAFAGMDSPWLNAVRSTLDRERFEAELDRNDVALSCGRHAGLLPELYMSADGHPLDERLAGQLMVALYRSGRAAEALDLYRRMRSRLVEELGTEPGPALQQIQRRILATDSQLLVRAPTVISAPIPRQLPAPPRLFIGRQAELAELDQIIGGERGNAVAAVLLGGIGGIGKTCLALHWAHRNLARFPDGQLFVNLRGFDPYSDPTTPEAALRTLLEALGVPPGGISVGVDARAGLFRSLVAGRRMLILLDNAHDSGQVAPLLPGDPSCAVLVTSRQRLDALVTSHGAQPVELDTLGEADARRLLTMHLGSDRVGAAGQAVRELLACCAGLPLALSLVAARAAARPALPLATLAEELREVTTRLDLLAVGELSTNLRAVFDCSLKVLSAPTAQVFGLLGLAPGGEVDLNAAVCLTGQPIARVRLALASLEYAHLVQQYKPGRYRMHDLVQLYAAERAKSDLPPAERTAAVNRLIDYYLHTACTGEMLLRPHSEPIRLGPPPADCFPKPLNDLAAALAWFEAEHTCLLATHKTAGALGRLDAVWRLAWALDTFHSRRGYRHENVTLWEAGLAAAQRAADRGAVTLAHRRLGLAYSLVGRHAESHSQLREALALAELHQDVGNRAHTEIALAWAVELDGHDEQALSHSVEALRLFRSLGDATWEAIASNAVGWYCARLGNYGDAYTYCLQALELSRRQRNRACEAATLDSLGYIAHQTGEYAQAIAHYRNALCLYREFGNHYTEADTLVRLSEVLAVAGERATARRDLEQALVLYRAQHRGTDAERVNRLLVALG